MTMETLNPAALAGANRAGKNIRDFDAPDARHNKGSLTYPQAFIARRFHLQPVVARLVCDLAGIGGRAQ